ncbi:hypothetical protein [Corynebacterium hindlerae]|uniref:hypothetical protein n=1 Tax=Corynebacterium hindlerae TaxID=699041 RepID=UPI003AAE3F23
MAKFNTNELHRILKATHHDLKTKAQALNADSHLTDEGKAAQWSQLTKKHQSELQDVITAVENMGTNITRQVDDLERDYYDTTRIPQSELLAAELGAARIMGRGKMDIQSIHNHINRISKGTITGADIIVINEAMARGVVSLDDVRTSIEASSGLYHSATREANKVQAAINTIMKPLAKECASMIADYRATVPDSVANTVAIESITGPDGIDMDM